MHSRSDSAGDGSETQAAERAASKYITGAVYHSKRLIGRPYTEDLQREREQLHWPFGVVDRRAFRPAPPPPPPPPLVLPVGWPASAPARRC